MIHENSPGAHFLGPELRYRISDFDAIDEYIFQVDMTEVFSVRFRVGRDIGRLDFSESALQSGVGMVAFCQGSPYSSNNEYVMLGERRAAAFNEDSPPFLLSRNLFAELTLRGATTLRFGEDVAVSVLERTNVKVVIDGIGQSVPVVRFGGERDFVGESGKLEFWVVDDHRWPIILRSERGGKGFEYGGDSDIYMRFEEAGRNLAFSVDD